MAQKNALQAGSPQDHMNPHDTVARALLDRVETNPLVFWQQWDFLRSPAKDLFFFAYLRLAMIEMSCSNACAMSMESSSSGSSRMPVVWPPGVPVRDITMQNVLNERGLDAERE